MKKYRIQPNRSSLTNPSKIFFLILAADTVKGFEKPYLTSIMLDQYTKGALIIKKNTEKSVKYKLPNKSSLHVSLNPKRLEISEDNRPP